MNYNLIIEQLAECIKYCLPISITIGLIERVCNIVIRAATGREI